MVDFAIDGLDEMVAFAIDGLGMTWQLHIKTRTKVRVFRAKNYLLKVLTFSTRKWPKNYFNLQMYLGTILMFRLSPGLLLLFFRHWPHVF